MNLCEGILITMLSVSVRPLSPLVPIVDHRRVRSLKARKAFRRGLVQDVCQRGK